MKKSNFLIVVTDQQRFDTISAAGYPYMDTPNMDKLVKEGCLFENAYSPDPICIPARHSLITGMTPKYHGFFDNGGTSIKDNGIPTLGRIFSENGWHTAAIGKSHFVPPTNHHGYDELLLMEELPEDVEDDEYLKTLRNNGYSELRNIHGVRTMLYHEPQIALVPDELHGTTWLGNYASDWIEKNQHRPWLLTLGWIKPHPPWNVPKSQLNRYKDKDLPNPHPQAVCPPFPQDALNYGWDDNDEEKRRIREAYYTSISMVDDAFGVVMNTLENTNLLDDTFIIFTSDHGEMLQDRGMYQKMVPYESASRIPFVIRYPKHFKGGSVDSRFIDLMDILPTLMESAGIDYNYKECNEKYTLSGGSLLSNSKNCGKRNRDIQISEFARGKYRWIMARDKQYKFIHFYCGNKEYLYDLNNDLGESNNLIGQSNCPKDVLKKLKDAAIEHELNLGISENIEDNTFKHFEDTDGGIYPFYDWNNGDKYPRWSYMAFQNFGREHAEQENQFYLNELVNSVGYCGGEKYIKSIKCQLEGKDSMCEIFNKNGGDDEKLKRILFDR